MSLTVAQKKSIGNKCVTDELFGKPFYIRVPYQASVPLGELKTFGLTGFYEKEEMIRELENPIVVRASIAQMTEIIQDGFQVSLVRPHDAEEMFNLIVQHLKNWKEVTKKFPNNANPPFEDLILLDSVAGLLYPHLPEKEKGDSLKNSNLLTGAILGLNFLNPLFNKEDTSVKYYESFAPFFIEEMYKFEEYKVGD